MTLAMMPMSSKTIIAVVVTLGLVGAGCAGSPTAESPASVNVSTGPVQVDPFMSCGDFPTVDGGSKLTERYWVCVSAATGECYYQATRQVLIDGCDPYATEADPYGREECYRTEADIHDSFGYPVPARATDYQSTDPCRQTTEGFYRLRTNQ